MRLERYRVQRHLAALACLLTAALGGCSYAPRDTRAVFEPLSDTTATARPMAQMPTAAGSVVAVLQSIVGGVLTQRIVLAGDPATDGENVIIVKVDQNPRRFADIDNLVATPTEDGIAKELDANFSYAMSVSPSWNHNSFGPFGYAVGRALGDVTCIYAWQYSAGAPPQFVVDAVANSAAASMPSAPTSVRVRLCRQGLGEEDLVALVRALQVYPPGGGSPYVDTTYSRVGPLGAGDALQAAGAPGPFYLRPVAPIEPRVKLHVNKPRTVRRARRPRVLVSRFPRRAEPLVLDRVIVPLPPSSGGAATSGLNPLLAPLQSLPRARTATSTDDMPLPGAAFGGAAPGARPQNSSVPLPN